jgi:hypothetical protein
MSDTMITEGLDYHDLEGQMEPVLSVDEYAAKMGKDKDIITLSFVVKSEQAGNDLVNWFERGYDWILDASLSEGEIEVGKFLVFVEMNRRSSAPRRICELLTDLKTLTDLKLSEWTITIQDEDYEADEAILQQVMILNPNLYKAEEEMKDEEINEMRLRAGLEHKQVHQPAIRDALLKAYLEKAGL